ncbi:MAG: ATP-dependent helicase HrpB [Proteobacteria bacterium]|nr:ATP-dependent helicase HrpB [Pseudomonadota bacterium]
MALPIDALLPELVAAAGARGNLVVVAPPGTGKTTRLPPALLSAAWLSGQVWLLEPRRLAARAAAARIAEERGWTLGHEVGFHVRFERRYHAATRLLVLTEGILTRRLLDDPALEGVGAVVLDEFHERSVHSDLGLALLKEVQRELRPDLRLIVMSATLQAEPVAAYLGGCPILRLNNEPHPLETCYLPAPPRDPLTAVAARTVRRALRDDPHAGDLLVFLPGAGEIARATELLADLADAEVVPLHGSLPSAAQDRALRAGERRRVVLSTNVAETSVTVAGVRTVIDSGQVRLPRHDPRTGLDRLELTRISAASADQRAGRAARLGPGRVYRLWTAAEQASLATATPPELRRIDLAPVVLTLRCWGRDPQTFDWLEAPERGALASAEQLLVRLGALDPLSRHPTTLGRELLALPLHPRLARLLVAARAAGCAREGATLAALLSERDLLAPAALAGDPTRRRPAADPISARSDLLERLERFEEAERRGQAAAPLLRLVLSAFPDRVVLRREGERDRGRLVGGRGVVLDPRSAVRDEPLYVAVEVDGAGREARVLVASAIDPAWLSTREEQQLSFDEATERVVASRCRLYEDLCLHRAPVTPDPTRAATLLAEHAARDPRRALQPSPAVDTWLARLRWLRRALPELELPAGDDTLLARCLPALCHHQTSFAELRRADLLAALGQLLSAEQARALAREAPELLQVPSGRHVPLAYRDEKSPPVLALPLQELFGCTQTPRLARNRQPVLLELLAPNGRPVQVTQDLASFWHQTYPQLRPALQRRYPKHAWPDDPLSARPVARGRR